MTHGTAKLSKDRKTLTIRIGEKVTRYEVSDADPDPKVAWPVIALRKANGEVHHVAKTEWGISCSCGAFCFRNYDNAPCKHCMACIATGLMPK